MKPETNTGRKLKAIGYARVSTTLQEAEGYSLEAQQQAIEQYCAQEGYHLIESFNEVESGTNSTRTVVNKVLKLCEITNAKMVVARLDRFSRDVHFLTSVQKRNINFIALDNPSADSMVLQILVSVAENESRLIGARTRVALAVAKANGVELGNYKIILASYQRIKNQNPTGWEQYVRIRKLYDKYIKDNPKWNDLVRDCEPLYEFIDTEYGFTEIIRKPIKVGKNQVEKDEDTYWENWSEKLGMDWPDQHRYSDWIYKKYGLHFGSYPVLPEPSLARERGIPSITIDGTTISLVSITKMLEKLNVGNTKAATDARVNKAIKRAKPIQPIINQARKEGYTSLRQIGKYLESKNIETPTGKATWPVSSVQSILKLLER
jgi:DNA invertase Pin-like site-specific DNA recombinase